MTAKLYVLDSDPSIPTGIPATPERVAELIVDPDSATTIDVLDVIVAEQRPTPEQIVEAAAGQ